MTWTNAFQAVIGAMAAVTMILIGAVYTNIARENDKLDARVSALEARATVDETAAAALRQQVFDDERTRQWAAHP